MATPFQKNVKKTLSVAGPFQVYPDQIVCKSNGTVEVKHSYFYAHGNTARGWAEKVEKALTAKGLTNIIVDGRDDWANWPKTSYFTAVVYEIA